MLPFQNDFLLLLFCQSCENAPPFQFEVRYKVTTYCTMCKSYLETYNKSLLIGDLRRVTGKRFTMA